MRDKVWGQQSGAEQRFMERATAVATQVRRRLFLYVPLAAVVLAAAVMVPVQLIGGSGTTRTAAGGQGSVAAAGPQGAANGATSTGESVSAASGGASGGTVAGSSLSFGSGGSSSGGGGAVAGPTGGGGNTGSGGGASSGPIAPVQTGTGTTRGGFACAPGVRQIPLSSYADPCISAFSGNNGGATYRGVTATTILLADRDCPQSANSQAVQQFAQAAGAASTATSDGVRDVFLNYFQKVFDLYGRHVVIQKYPVSGGSDQCTLEAESQGKDAACADADGIANSMKAFGETGQGIYSEGAGGGGSGPFSECAASQKLVEFSGGGYFPQSWYDKYNPYVWDGIMGCDRIAYEVGEALSKQTMGKPAQWAGDPLIRTKQRVLGTYVPNNPEYQECVHVYQTYLKNKGFNPGYTFNYVLDVSRFADQASQAVVQFHAEGVTTIVLACDPISPIFLTEEADGQNYFPEWYNIGVALNDFDTVPRLWDAKEIDGHYFGLSQLGPSESLVGPQSEPGILYQKITGKTIPQGTNGDYYGLLTIFNMLQAAGPDLTPQNMARGLWALPPGGAPVPGGTKFAYAAGYTCYCTNWDGTKGVDHTAVEDSREVYWNNAGTSPYDGKTGTFIAIWNGARFLIGNFPAGSPPFYPKGCNPDCKTPPPSSPPPPGAHEGG